MGKASIRTWVAVALVAAAAASPVASAVERDERPVCLGYDLALAGTDVRFVGTLPATGCVSRTTLDLSGTYAAEGAEGVLALLLEPRSLVDEPGLPAPPSQAPGPVSVRAPFRAAWAGGCADARAEAALVVDGVTVAAPAASAPLALLCPALLGGGEVPSAVAAAVVGLLAELAAAPGAPPALAAAAASARDGLAPHAEARVEPAASEGVVVEGAPALDLDAAGAVRVEAPVAAATPVARASAAARAATADAPRDGVPASAAAPAAQPSPVSDVRPSDEPLAPPVTAAEPEVPPPPAPEADPAAPAAPAARAPPAVASASAMRPPAAGLPAAAAAAGLAAALVLGALALYQRVARPAALRHPARAALHAALEAAQAPESAASLGAAAGLARKTAEYHLVYLVRLGLVREVALPDGRRLFARPAGPTAPRADAVAERLRALAAARPGLTTREAAEALGVTRGQLDRRAKDLLAAGALASRLDDGERRLFAAGT